jgi:hypothetical protein
MAKTAPRITSNACRNDTDIPELEQSLRADLAASELSNPYGM